MCHSSRPAESLRPTGTREARDSISKEMTSDQLAEAQKMAREMVEANPKVMGE